MPEAADRSEAGGKSSVERVRAALRAAGLDAEIKQFDASTRSSADAAAAIGCTVAQIAKSVVFRAKPSGRPVLVIASGVNRVDEKKLEALLGEKVGKADADFVRAETGFAIGGVAPVGHAPVGHDGRVTVFIDEDLIQYAEIWAAAGSPNAVFKLTPANLRHLTGGKVAALKQA